MVGRVQSQEGYPRVIIIVVVVDVVKVVRSHLSWSFVELLSLSLFHYRECVSLSPRSPLVFIYPRLPFLFCFCVFVVVIVSFFSLLELF